MANAENINQVIEAIRNEQNYFSMAAFAVADPKKDPVMHNNSAFCGSPACIAGWAAFISHDGKLPTWQGPDDQSPWVEPNPTLHVSAHVVEDAASEFLGIIDPERLFYGEDKEGFVTHIESITREEAIKTLEILRDTGEVCYSHCKDYIKFEKDE